MPRLGIRRERLNDPPAQHWPFVVLDDAHLRALIQLAAKFGQQFQTAPRFPVGVDGRLHRGRRRSKIALPHGTAQQAFGDLNQTIGAFLAAPDFAEQIGTAGSLSIGERLGYLRPEMLRAMPIYRIVRQVEDSRYVALRLYAGEQPSVDLLALWMRANRTNAGNLRHLRQAALECAPTLLA